MKHRISLLLIALAMLSACRQQKELVYFEGLNTARIVNETALENREYKIRVNDILYVKVLTLDPNINLLFSAATPGSISTYSYYGEDVRNMKKSYMPRVIDAQSN